MHKYGFTKSFRLLKSTDFKAVFDNVERRFSSTGILVLCKKNRLQQPRLGLVVPKKVQSSAVKRNLYKRLIRETFRLNSHSFPGLDLVVLVRKEIIQLNQADLWLNLNKLWHNIAVAHHKP